MLAEHDGHGAHLRALRAVTGNFTLPEGACAAWRALYAGLRKFADDLVEHTSIENNMLFPRFTACKASPLAERSSHAAGRWTCADRVQIGASARFAMAQTTRLPGIVIS